LGFGFWDFGVITSARQLADLIIPSRDYFACPEHEIADLTSDLTMVGGKVVYAVGDFARLDSSPPPRAMPDWSPTNVYGGFGAWKARSANPEVSKMSDLCGCGSACNIHGHAHAQAWSNTIPADDLKAFWGALGCACWWGV